MNYFKPKMDDYNKAFVIVFCFLLLGLFVIVPIVLLVYSHNLRMFYLYEGLSFSNIILICYCVVVLVGAGIFLYYIYKNQKEEKVTNINNLITESINNIDDTKKAINSLIDQKLKENKLTDDLIKTLINYLTSQNVDKEALTTFIQDTLKAKSIIS